MSDVTQLLRQGLDANPTDWNLRKGVLEHLIKDGSDRSVVAEIVESAPAAPDDAGLAKTVATMLAGHDANLASSFVGKALAVHPSDGWLHGSMAKLKLASGDVDSAKSHYTAAKTFDPSYSDEALEAISAPAAEPAPPTVDLGPAPAEPEVEAAPVEPVAEAAPVEPVEPVEPVAEAVVEEAEAVVEEAVAEAPAPIPTPALAPPPQEEIPAVQEWVEEPAQVVEVVEAEPEVHVSDLHFEPVQELPVVQPLVDPNSVPDTPDLLVDNTDFSNTQLQYTSAEELELTRSHLLVAAPVAPGLEEGEIHFVDADEAYATEDEMGEGVLLAGGAGDPPPIAEKDNNREKIGALITTVLVHVGLFFLIGLIIVAAPKPKPPEIVASPGPVTNEPQVTKKQVTQQMQTKPPAASPNIARTISAAAASPVTVPSVDIDTPDDPIDLGSTMGNVGFGTFGSAAGGSVSFMGNEGSGSRVVFAVDYSRSMSGFSAAENAELKRGRTPSVTEWRRGGRVSKHMMVRDELIRAIKKLPAGTQYQIIMFSAWAWAHDAIEEEWLEDPSVFDDKGDRIKTYINQADAHSTSRGDDFEFPRVRYLTVNDSNVERTTDIVARLPTSLGTNWEHPVLMALSLSPRPDIVFFMTDGMVGNPERALGLVAERNRSRRTTIHTTAMMEPKAARQLSDLATENGGNFTIVLQDGEIQSGEEFFKN